MPCLAANCTVVSSPRNASSATFALNSAEYRVRLPVIGSVLLRPNRAYPSVRNPGTVSMFRNQTGATALTVKRRTGHEAAALSFTANVPILFSRGAETGLFRAFGGSPPPVPAAPTLRAESCPTGRRAHQITPAAPHPSAEGIWKSPMATSPSGRYAGPGGKSEVVRPLARSRNGVRSVKRALSPGIPLTGRIVGGHDGIVDPGLDHRRPATGGLAWRNSPTGTNSQKTLQFSIGANPSPSP